MFIVLLVAGLWMAVYPEAMLHKLRQFGLEIQRFANAQRAPQPGSDSALMRLAMRLFGIAVASLAFAGLAGYPR